MNRMRANLFRKITEKQKYACHGIKLAPRSCYEMMPTATHHEAQAERFDPLRQGSPAIALMASKKKTTDRFQDLAFPLLTALYNHACWLVRDKAEAEDLVQETLAKALRAFDSFEPGTNFKAWIYRILRNTYLTSRTALANSRTIFLEDHAAEIADPGWTPEALVIQADNLAAVRRALEELPPHLREVILLCELEELKYREVAAVLDVPIGTVMSRLARARQALYELLKPTFGGVA
jgi:RNA polymerase sigma-70 factor (ECF subfamily)